MVLVVGGIGKGEYWLYIRILTHNGNRKYMLYTTYELQEGKCVSIFSRKPMNVRECV